MTADGRGGPGDRSRPPGLTRRRLLAGLGSVGAVGMASGAGTFAYLTDDESLVDNTLGAGKVAFEVSCGRDNTGDCTVTDGHVSFAIDGLDRGSHGRERFNVAVSTNPARLWFATVCPEPDLAAFDPLGDELAVSLVVGNGGATTVFTGSLSALREAFADGLRIDDLDGGACIAPGETLELTLYWELPIDASGSAAGRKTAFEFRLYTEQCRHVSEDDAAGSNPFAGLGPCGVLSKTCPRCVFGGKADNIDGDVSVSDPDDPSTWLSIDEGGLAGEAFLFVTDVQYKDVDEAVGVRFKLVDANGDPFGDLCEVRIKGGPTTNRHPIEPPSFDTGSVLLTPDGPGNSGRRGIKNVEIDVCADEEPDQDDPDEPDEPDEPNGCVECPDEETQLLDLTFRYLGTDAVDVTAVPIQGNAASGVLFEGTVDADDRFTLDGTALDRKGNKSDWIGPNVEIAVDDGPTVTVHTSCSEALAVGNTFGTDGSGMPLYELVAGTTTDDELLCGSEAL